MVMVPGLEIRPHPCRQIVSQVSAPWVISKQIILSKRQLINLRIIRALTSYKEVGDRHGLSNVSQSIRLRAKTPHLMEISLRGTSLTKGSHF